jgi:streptogramin lyase
MKTQPRRPNLLRHLTSPLRLLPGALLLWAMFQADAQPWTRDSLTLWLKADAGVTADANNAVSQWDDQSTGANHVAQADGGQQPLLLANGLNGLPVLQFRDDWLVRTGLSGTNLFSSNAATVFLVQKQLGSDQRTTTLAWRAGGEQRLYVHATYDDTVAFQVGHPSNGGGIGVTQPSNWDDTWHLLSCRRDDTNGVIRVDGVALTPPAYFTANANPDQLGDLVIGSDHFGNTFNGDIAEVMVFNEALSDADRAEVENYLLDKWAVPAAPAAVPDLLVKAAGEPTYAGNGLYQLQPADSQIRSQNVAALQKATFNVRVENDGTVAGPVIFRATETATAGWSVTYRQGVSDITAQIVSAAGFTNANLLPGGGAEITVEVTMTGVVLPGVSKAVTVRASDAYLPGLVRDAVQVVGVATAGVQPDLLVRRDIDPNPAGDGLYNLTGQGQSKWQQVATNQTATYFVTLGNDGNANAQFKLQGTAGGGGWAVNCFGFLLGFDGADDYVDLGAWAPGTNWTVEAWVKPSALPTGRRSIAGGMNEARDWGITMQDGQFGVVTKPLDGASTITFRSGEPVVTDIWYHVAGTCDGTNAFLYVNGVLKASGPVYPGYTGSAASTRIGSESCCGGNSFPGVIRDVRIWNRPLAEAEVASGMASPIIANEAGLEGYWRLDAGGQAQARDLGPKQRHGTLVNGVAWQRQDINAAVTGAGWSDNLIGPGGSVELVVEVSPDETVPGGAAKAVLLTATAVTDASKADTVKLTTSVVTPSTTPVNALFTTTAQFELGWMSGLEAWSVADQLQLSETSGVLPYLWVPNANDNSVSKVDTRTGREVARYRTSPSNVTGNPSRTTVDLRGNCWVANRNSATVVKIGLLEHGEFADRNGDGLVQTSRDLNGDGSITGTEMLEWGQDECVLHEVLLVPGSEARYTPGTYRGSYPNNYWNPGPRGVAVDSQGNLWAGTHDTMKYYYINGETGQILRTIDVSPANHMAYGAAIDQRGILWSSGYKESGEQNLLRLDPADGSFSKTVTDFHTYGIAIDRNNHLFVSGHQESVLTRWNTETGALDWKIGVGANPRGIAITDDDDVWVINSGANTLTRLSNDGVIKSVIGVGPTPTGVTVDAAGKIWVCGTGDENIRRIDPATDTVDLVKRIAGSHYGYSDMTGTIVRNSTVRLGLWSVVHDAQVANTAWGSVTWHGRDATGTNILVRVRSSNDRTVWSAWETAASAAALTATPPGRYLEFEVTLRSVPGDVAPILDDIAATGRAPAAADLAISLDAEPNPVLSEYPQTLSVIVANRSVNWASGVVVTSDLPASFDLMAVTVPGGFYQRTGNRVVCTIAGIGPSAATTITFAGSPLQPGAVALEATVTANESDPVPNNNTATLPLTVQAVPCAVPPAGFVAWWPGDGHTNDVAGTNDLTAQGGPTFVAAKAGEGFLFDSNDDRLSTPHNDAFNLNRTGFTAQFWMQGTKDQPGQSESLVTLLEKSHGWTDNTGWAFQVQPANGQFGFAAGYGGGTGAGFMSADSLVDVLDGRWHHIAGSWDGFNLRLFVDGTLQMTTPLLIPANNTRPVNLGFTWGNGNPRRFFRGLLDEVAIYNRALSPDEIAAIHGARSGGLCKEAPVIIQPTIIAEAVVGQNFNQSIVAALGTPPYTFAANAGTLPPGLSLSPQGVLSGQPDTAGTYIFTVRATDSMSDAADRNYTQIVSECVPRPAGLVGFWNADDATDNLVGTNHGTLEYNGDFAPGRVGQAFILDGNDDAVRLFGSSGGPLRITTDQLTIGAWVNQNVTNPPARGYSLIFDKAWDGSPNGYEFAVVMGELRLWLATTDAGQGASVSFPLPKQRWVHVAASYDGAMMRLYQDGVEVASAPLTGTVLPNNHDACIGNDNWPGSREYAFNGLIDELMVFNRALAAAEVQGLFNTGAASLCPVLSADLLVKDANEPDAAYTLDNSYQPVPAVSQTKAQSVYPLAVTAYDVRIQNDGPTPRTFTLKTVESGEPDWNLVYRQAATDISVAIRSTAGYTTAELAPGASQVVRVEMSPGLSVAAFSTKTAVVNATLDGGAVTVRDAVKLVSTCWSTFQPDLMIRRERDDSFAGEGVFNATALGQTRLLEVPAGETATYYVQLKNYGNATNRIRLQATPAGEGWSASFCSARPVLHFDGTDDYVSVPDSPALHSDRQLTVSGWFRTEGFPRTWQNIFWKGNTPDCTGGCENREYALWLNGNGHLSFSSTPESRIGVGELGVGTPAGTIQVGQWYHFAAVLDSDANKMRIYVNGELKADGPYATSNIRTTTGPLNFGINKVGEWAFLGGIQHISLWSTALTAEDIAGLMAQNPSGNEADLMSYWPLLEGSGLTALDYSANANAGTLINGPVWTFDPPTIPGCYELAPLLGAGWTNLALAPKASYDIVVRLTPNAGVTPGTVKEVTLTASSIDDPAQLDAVKAIVSVLTPGTTPQGGTYTANFDFEKGRVSGVEYTTVADQLQLTDKSAALRYLWVPNSEGTISKVDVLTGRELGRYRTGPPEVNSQPSRTTVDLLGNCYVANRYSGTLVKVGLSELGQGIDRNGDGIFQTSHDLNGDGDITGDELLAWGADECVLWETSLIPSAEGNFVPGTFTGPYQNSWGYPGVRGVAVDTQGNVWVGTLDTRKFYYLNGSTGRILRTIDVSSVNHQTYGAVLDRSGILWASSHDRNEVMRLDPATGAFTVIPLGHFSYGISVDRQGHVFVSGWNSSRLSRLDSATATIDWSVAAENEGRGVAVTDDGDIWTAHSGPGLVVRRSNTGAFKASIPAGNQPTGVAVDSRGMIWAVGLGDDVIRRIDPSRNVVDLTKRILCAYREGYHYGYSDMTGNMARNSTTRIGFWTVVHNGKVPNVPWGLLTWQGDEPDGTTIGVRVRSSNNQQTWSLWESVRNGVALHATPPGQFLEIEVTLQSSRPEATPAFYGLTVQPASEANYGVKVYTQDFTGDVGPEWSANLVAVTPTGGRRFLGEFGNQSVTLTLNNLPPHAAVTVVFDQFVIRGWDGSSPTDGPDLWEVNLAGGLKLVQATFNNGPDGEQSFPGVYPGDTFPARTGALENNSLGFALSGGGVTDSVYRHVQIFPHTANSLTLNFLGSGLAALAEESWGLDNVQVYLVPQEGPPEITGAEFTAQGLRLTIEAVTGWTYVVEASGDLVDWSALQSTQPNETLAEYLDPEALTLGQRFYRVRRLP